MRESDHQSKGAETDGGESPDVKGTAETLAKPLCRVAITMLKQAVQC